MKGILLALGEITDKAEGELDSALAVPVSKALADYMPDVYQILSPGSIDYVRAGAGSAPPWRDDDGIHMSLARVTLLHVMRHPADRPATYAQLRDAASQHAAGSFAAVPRDAEEWSFESPTRETAYVLGAMDAGAEDVQKDLGEDGWKDWSTDVFSRLTRTSSTPPSYQDAPARQQPQRLPRRPHQRLRFRRALWVALEGPMTPRPLVPLPPGYARARHYYYRVRNRIHRNQYVRRY
ncbi:hypothetical protein OHU34_44470 (plasmid) [Streptomyces sp. NBC_00080]|uniref:hypothetical protein n=1 Tax=Streptomyces sp. NBC_00080 TaxID=2975645 RepID=UPI00324B730F